MAQVGPLLASSRVWPDFVDLGAILMFFGGIAVLLMLSYLLMVVDFRAYLRALRGVLVRVKVHFSSVPGWARYETPGCLLALDLRLPCTEADVKQAYRSKAERLHPDRGGDRRKFLQLQRQFENAIKFLREHEEELRNDP